jgi:hypothetical protein
VRSTQLDPFAHTLSSFSGSVYPAAHPWYDSATLGLAVGITGCLIGLVGGVIGLLTWRWSIRQVRTARTTAQQVEAALADDRKRSARFQLLNVPAQLAAVEHELVAAIQAAAPADRPAARGVLARLRSVAAEASQYLVAAELTGVSDDDRGQFSVLLLLVDTALGDLHDRNVAVRDATARIPIQLSSTTTAALRIAVTITTS